jgi:hypothetical protein
MIASTFIWEVTLAASQAALFGLVFAAVNPLLQLVIGRKRFRWAWTPPGSTTVSRFYRALVRLTAISEDREGVQLRIQLLKACGFPLDAMFYLIWKRCAVLLSLLIGAGSLMLAKRGVLAETLAIYIGLAAAIVLILAACDKTLLEAARIRRARKIVREVYVVSHQLLYYNGSRMNLHTKLTRCLPLTRYIRNEFQLLLNEWYYNADAALQRFKDRLGTEEAHSFAETLNSLRMHECNSYYNLLKQRIDDYKEKLDLAKESRKETTSYLLFVLAGIPILNTFRVFIYPWVTEGQKLFQTLN